MSYPQVERLAEQSWRDYLDGKIKTERFNTYQTGYIEGYLAAIDDALRFVRMGIHAASSAEEAITLMEACKRVNVLRIEDCEHNYDAALFKCKYCGEPLPLLRGEK